MKVYLLLADGFELIEALTPVDVFRRAGITIITVALGNHRTVMSSNLVEVQADTTWARANISHGDALILPGGYPGYDNLAKDNAVGELAKIYYESGRIVGAICGAPIILQIYGIGKGKHVTSHRCVKDQMVDFIHTGHDVEVDGNLITAIGAGHALDFSLALLSALCGQEAVDKIKPGRELK